MPYFEPPESPKPKPQTSPKPSKEDTKPRSADLHRITPEFSIYNWKLPRHVQDRIDELTEHL